MEIKTTRRIESIDVLRGIVMIIMALDHVRIYFHDAAATANPLDLATTTPLLFFTRWITHFCAPVFVFLSGTSAFLQSRRKTKKELSGFLITRGLWLILVEVAIISFAWSFNPAYNALFIQVIWAIGISMVLLGILIYLPFELLLTLGIIIVIGHNLLDIPESEPGFKAGFLWDLLHHGHFSPYFYAPGHVILIVYPFLPWLGLMILGYCFGKIFANEDVARRKRILNFMGFTLIALYFILRIPNAYGDPVNWALQKNAFYTFLSFINANKYPPSLLFMCMTIGPALLVLSVFENVRNRFTNFSMIFGRVALFYYIIHLYLIHFLSSISFFMRGHTMEQAYDPARRPPFYFVLAGEGLSLGAVYLVWIFVIILLYPVCRRYDRYKIEHKEKKWLSYL